MSGSVASGRTFSRTTSSKPSIAVSAQPALHDFGRGLEIGKINLLENFVQTGAGAHPFGEGVDALGGHRDFFLGRQASTSGPSSSTSASRPLISRVKLAMPQLRSIAPVKLTRFERRRDFAVSRLPLRRSVASGNGATAIAVAQKQFPVGNVAPLLSR